MLEENISVVILKKNRRVRNYLIKMNDVKENVFQVGTTTLQFDTDCVMFNPNWIQRIMYNAPSCIYYTENSILPVNPYKQITDLPDPSKMFAENDLLVMHMANILSLKWTLKELLLLLGIGIVAILGIYNMMQMQQMMDLINGLYGAVASGPAETPTVGPTIGSIY